MLRNDALERSESGPQVTFTRKPEVFCVPRKSMIFDRSKRGVLR